MKSKLLLILSALGVHYLTFGQSISPSTINVAGTSSTLNTNVYEWSLGEMVAVNTLTTPEVILSQGLLQGEIIITAVSDEGETEIEIAVFPNPTSEFVYIQANDGDFEDVRLQILDAKGGLIAIKHCGELNAQETTEYDMTTHPVGTYFLKIICKSNGEIIRTKTMQIVKI